MAIGLSINGRSHSKKEQFEEGKQDWLVQKLGLRRPKRFAVILAEYSLLLLIQEDKKRLCSQGGIWPTDDHETIKYLHLRQKYEWK